jgi:GNAT superfamily N-acetyltransferase
MTAEIRQARADEAEAIAALVAEAYRGYIPRIGRPPGPMLDDYAQRIAAGQAWVLQDADGLAGALVLEPRADMFLLDNVAVRPDRQGRGYGRRLIGFAEDTARRSGWKEIRLYTHVLMTENIALYERSGYVAVARVQEKGFDRVYMVKSLAAGAVSTD